MGKSKDHSADKIAINCLCEGHLVRIRDELFELMGTTWHDIIKAGIMYYAEQARLLNAAQIAQDVRDLEEGIEKAKPVILDEPIDLKDLFSKM